MTTGSEIRDVRRNEDGTQNVDKNETLQTAVAERLLDETNSPTPLLSKIEKEMLRQNTLLKQLGYDKLEEPSTLSLSPERRQRLEEVVQVAAERQKDKQEQSDGKESSGIEIKEAASSKKETLDKPLKSPQEIANEAKKLNDYANKFLSGSNEDQSFKQWTDELNKLAKSNDIDTVKKVFQKIAENNSGANPLLNSVTVRSTEEGGIKINMSPSALLSGLGSLNHRHISASIESSSVFTHAIRNDANLSQKSSYKKRQ